MAPRLPVRRPRKRDRAARLGRTLPVVLALLGSPAIVACGSDPETLPALGHYVVHLDTDAPVLPAPGTLRDPDEPAPLFDRLIVDVFPAGSDEACGSCSRDLELTRDELEAGATFTLRVEGGGHGAPRVRARMFRSDLLLLGDVPAESTVETVVQLPAQPREGGLDVAIFLSTDRLGAPAGTLDDPEPATRGAPEGSRVGTWPGAQRVPCAAPPGPGEVCVPGGAFWMGNPRVGRLAETAAAADRLRLVVLAPFFLDVRETTVADVRGSGHGGDPGVGEWSGELTGDSSFDLCPYVASAGVHDAFPMGCVAWKVAGDVCAARGGDLPTEAQLEYAAGDRASELFPWGHDDPACGDAVFGLDAPALQALGLIGPNDHNPCPAPAGRTAEEAFGFPSPAPATPEEGAGLGRARDRIEVGGAVVWDLAGNQLEWARDVFQDQGEPCWDGSRGLVRVDPVCEEPGALGPVHSLRGGAWLSTAAELRAATRRWADDIGAPHVGFRCARPGR